MGIATLFSFALYRNKGYRRPKTKLDSGYQMGQLPDVLLIPYP